MSGDIGFSMEELEELYVVFKVRNLPWEWGRNVVTHSTNSKVSWKGSNGFALIINVTYQKLVWHSVTHGAGRTGPITIWLIVFNFFLTEVAIPHSQYLNDTQKETVESMEENVM